jgi:hypothetical protein
MGGLGRPAGAEGVDVSVAIQKVTLSPLWRTRKSHFQPSVVMGRKNVDKNIDKHNKQ